MRRAWRWWVAVWDRREPPDVLAVIRIGVGLVLLGDFATTARLGLVDALFRAPDGGGLASPTASPLWIDLFGGGAWSARALLGGLCASAALLASGAASRSSALALMLLSAQWAAILPDGDRAIDMFLRNVLLILAFSRAGDRFSVDAWWATGGWRGSGEPAPAWPRYLLVLQIVVMYFAAGVQKYGQHWWPWGGCSALYVILHDWSYARGVYPWLDHQPFVFGAQVSTAVTLAWQWTYPIVLVHYFALAPSDANGPLGRFRRYRLHWLWIAVGALFHLAIAATMALGIFPYGMLVVYPAFLAPDELRSGFARAAAAVERVRYRARSRRTSAG